MEVYKLEKSEDEVTVLVGVGSPEEAGMQLGGKLQELELPRILNLERRVVSTLNGLIWIGGDCRCSIALTYPVRSHFQRTLSRERRGKG